MNSGRSNEQLRIDAVEIWQAGVDAVEGGRLVVQNLQLSGDTLEIAGQAVSLEFAKKIIVVGAGKAGASMADAADRMLAPAIETGIELDGWVNVPAGKGDRFEPSRHIKVFEARPAGTNLPTCQAIEGTHQIMRLVESVDKDDLCICLLSGGASALLVAPTPPVTLSDKIAVTEFLSGQGATIRELNTVRKMISDIKGGQLAAKCRGQLYCLIISDVIDGVDNSIEYVASGPTTDNSLTAADALQVLNKFDPDRQHVSATIYELLDSDPARQLPSVSKATNVVIGDNSTAVRAAETRAQAMGYVVHRETALANDRSAEAEGCSLIDPVFNSGVAARYNCFVSGGEPTVSLVESSKRGKGGRNQQLVLAALDFLSRILESLDEPTRNRIEQTKFCLLSAGTDGEDGPTDAAGAWIDSESIDRAKALGLECERYLRSNDAYNFFAQLDNLLRTGPTDTNVCDLRVVLVG